MSVLSASHDTFFCLATGETAATSGSNELDGGREITFFIGADSVVTTAVFTLGKRGVDGSRDDGDQETSR